MTQVGAGMLSCRSMIAAQAAGVIVVAMLTSACARPAPPVQVVALPPGAVTASEADLDGYPAALAAIVNAFDGALGLPRVDVKLMLFADRKSFEEGLVTTGYPPELARAASSFAAIGGAREVFVNAAIVNRFDRTRRVQLVAHELVHSLQYQFSGGTRGASEQWLREGFAEWVSFRATEHLGLASFEMLRDDLLNPLSDVRFGTAPAPLDDLLTFPQWVDAQHRYEAPLYAQAFLAVELLIETRGVPAMVRYFEQFRSTSAHEPAFTQSFGMERAAFDALFARRWHETLARYRVRR